MVGTLLVLVDKPISRQVTVIFAQNRYRTHCSALVVRIFLSTPAQLAAIQRKVEWEKETLEQQLERVSPGM
jgi:hypothetical protein